MTSIIAVIKTHPVLTYLALVLGISWGTFLVVVGPTGVPGTGDEIERLMPVVYVIMVMSTCISGILLTGLMGAGLHDLLSRLSRWRVGAHWYAIAFLTPPVLVTASLFALSLMSPEFLPLIFTTDDKLFVVQFGITMGLTVGVFEEIGWTGFAIPMLRRHYGCFATGLVVGFSEGARNVLVVNWTSSGAAGSLPPILYLPAVLLTWIPAYRLFMVYVYDRTKSLPVAVLMHASLTAFWYVFTPQILAGAQLVAYYVLFAVMVYLAVGGVLWIQTLRRSVKPNLLAQG